MSGKEYPGDVLDALHLIASANVVSPDIIIDAAYNLGHSHASRVAREREETARQANERQVAILADALGAPVTRPPISVATYGGGTGGA